MDVKSATLLLLDDESNTYTAYITPLFNDIYESLISLMDDVFL